MVRLIILIHAINIYMQGAFIDPTGHAGSYLPVFCNALSASIAAFLLC